MPKAVPRPAATCVARGSSRALISLGADRLVADGPGARRQRSDAVNRGRGASASRGARASPDAVSRGASALDA